MSERLAPLATHRRGPWQNVRFLLASGVVLALGACASTPEPSAKLQAAQQAIADADRAQASEHAADDLVHARAKLAAANTAVQDHRMDEAERLADEARVDAELAAARTAAAKALAANDEIRRTTGAMIEEMQRNTTTGGTP